MPGLIGELGGFGTYITAAIHKKNVPLQVVANKDNADFEITSRRLCAARANQFGWWPGSSRHRYRPL